MKIILSTFDSAYQQNIHYLGIFLTDVNYVRYDNYYIICDRMHIFFIYIYMLYTSRHINDRLAGSKIVYANIVFKIYPNLPVYVETTLSYCIIIIKEFHMHL